MKPQKCPNCGKMAPSTGHVMLICDKAPKRAVATQAIVRFEEASNGYLAIPDAPAVLAALDKLSVAIASTTTIPDAKELHDRVSALQTYIRRKDFGIEVQNRGMEINIHSQRRLGELLQDMAKNPGKLLQGSASPPSHDARAEPRLQDLGINFSQSSRWQQLAAVPTEMFEEYVASLNARAESLTISGLIRNYFNELEAKAIAIEPPPLPTGPFRVIVIDPPWSYGRKEDATHRAANPYLDMSLDEIKALPVGALATEDAVLWLWTTNAYIREAFDLVEAWGFAYKTLLTWAKDKMGLGDWLRGQTEHCLMGIKGKPLIRLTNQTTLLNAPTSGHSRKPVEFYQMVDELCPGSKVDMFAREQRDGWTAWGSDVAL